MNIRHEVGLRRKMGPYRVVLLRDLSLEGCSVDAVERVNLDDVLWVRFPGLEALEGSVCWEKEHSCGIEFTKPLHPAVFDMLVARLTN